MWNRWSGLDAAVTMTGLVVAVQGLLLLGAAGVGLATHAGFVDLPDPSLLRPLCGFLLLLAAWSIVSWRLMAGVWFDPYTIFVAAAFLFNAGQGFLEVFGLNPGGVLDGKFSSERVMDALLLVTICLIGFHTGALLAAARRRRPSTSRVGAGPTLRDLREVGWSLLSISLPAMSVVSVGAVQTVMTAGYLALYAREPDIGLYALPLILGTFLVPAGLFVLAGSKELRGGRAASACVILLNAACQLFLGYRYYAFMPLIAYVWVWHRCIRPVPRLPVLAALLAAVIVVFPLIAATRNVEGGKRSVEELQEAYASIDNPAFASIHEMGGTLMATAHTLELVPSTRDFDYGLTYLYAMLTLFPNVAWDVHPSIAYGVPSNWLVWEVDPWLAERGGGLGFSFIAEAYLGFGWAGAPWILGLIGYLFARLTLWAQTDSGLVPAKVALAAAFISFFAFFARQESVGIVRALVWYSLLPYALIHVLAWSRRYFARSMEGTE
jgi:oligosaccharide repeat unit polymerase